VSDLTPEGLRARAEELFAVLDTLVAGDWNPPGVALETILAAFTALVAEARLEAGLVAQMPGRACARPDHNGGEGSEGIVYGLICGGCAFELAQDEAAEARRAQREADAREAWSRACAVPCLHDECKRARVICEAIRVQRP